MDIFAGETAPFAVALGLTLAIAIIELVGLLMGMQPSAVVDGALPDLDIPDADAPEMEIGALSQLLSWFNFGRLPALVVLLLLTTSFLPGRKHCGGHWASRWSHGWPAFRQPWARHS